MSTAVARLAVCLAMLAAGRAAAGAGDSAQQPNIVVIVVDTLRDDRVGASRPGHGSLTPFVDELARRGTRFTNAYATSSWTNPSVASLFTSRFPSQHRVRGYESTLVATEVTLAERLRDAGYVTGGFSANPQLQAARGWDQGFDVWRTFPSFDLRAPELTAACLSWLDGAWSRDGGRPLFLYLQYMEPHAPYEAPPAVRASVAPGVSDADMQRLNGALLGLRWHELGAADVADLEALYDAEVAAVDGALRELFAGLDARGALAGAVIVVTADHGEEFNEHQLFAHGFTLFEPAVRVPLIVAGGPLPAGSAAGSRVSLVDLAPALLDVVGLPGESRFEGRSLLPDAVGLAPRQDILMELLPWQDLDWRHHEAAFIQDDRKLLVPPPWKRALLGDSVFDLAVDPGETRTTPWGTEIDVLLLQQALDRRLDALAATRIPAEERNALTPEQRERLRALGYLE
jgi:arylsulfatase A-like enzyme